MEATSTVSTSITPEEGITISDAVTLLDMDVAKKVAEALHSKYPGHLWAVTVRDGAAIIKNLNVSASYGYVLYTSTIDADPNLRCVMRAGGEILERGAIERRRHEEGQQATHIDGVKDKYQPKLGIIV